MSKIRQLLTNNRGVTAIEYGLIASLIALFVLGALSLFGHNMSSELSVLATSV